MSELQIGLLAIGALVVAGVLIYNRAHERRAKLEAQRAFGSGHDDVLLAQTVVPHRSENAADNASENAAPGATAGALEQSRESAQPDPAIDYIVAFATEHSVAPGTLREQWSAIERRHARRTLLVGSSDGRSWRAGLQLVSRDGAIGEADLIEFRCAVETLAASVSATVSAPAMRAAVEAARALDEFCGVSDLQVVLHVTGGPFAGTKIRSAAQASGLVLEEDGKFALRNDEQQLVYTLGAQDGAAFSAATLRDAMPLGLSLSLDVTRAPDTQGAFDSLSRLARQLASVLGGAIVDDNGNALDERAVAAIALELDAVRARLEARGVTPGSPTALRLFS